MGSFEFDSDHLLRRLHFFSGPTRRFQVSAKGTVRRRHNFLQQERRLLTPYYIQELFRRKVIPCGKDAPHFSQALDAEKVLLPIHKPSF
jgi:hypothetical protein